MDNDNQPPEDKEKGNIVKGPWLDDNDISKEVIEEIERIAQQDAIDRANATKPYEEKIVVSLIEYFQKANKRKHQLHQLSDLNNSKSSMIEGLRLENKKLKEIITILEKDIKILQVAAGDDKE